MGIVPDYLDREHRELRRLIRDLAATYDAAADAPTLGQMRTHLATARGKLHDVEFQFTQTFIHQRRDASARPHGG